MLRSKTTLLLAAAAVAAILLESPASAIDTVSNKGAPDLTAVRAKIEAKDWPGAAADLRGLATTNQHADVYNLLAFSLRHMGQYAEAQTFYGKALDFDPSHKGAHEYLGELYVTIGEMDKAKVMLAKLAELCPQGCTELDDLQEAIAQASAKSPVKPK